MMVPVFYENQAECPNLAKNPKNRCSKNHDFLTFLAKNGILRDFTNNPVLTMTNLFRPEIAFPLAKKTAFFLKNT